MHTNGRQVNWSFPLPRATAGVPLGNGNVGVLVWGDASLHLTLARAGFWDRRGGTPFRSRTTYRDLRRLLEAGDEAGVRAAFAPPDGQPAQGRLLQQHGGARFVLSLSGWHPERAVLDLAAGLLRVEWTGPRAVTACMSIDLAMQGEAVWCAWDEALAGMGVACVPAGELQRDDRAERGIVPPEISVDADGGGGCVVQRLPADPALAIAWRVQGRSLALATALGGSMDEDPAVSARSRCADDPGEARRRSAAWWSAYWADVPRFDLPDAIVQQAVDLGLWKQAGLTPPQGVAAALQGPWMEDHRPPPWANDYHFNINVEMVYGPCLPTNRAAHLDPLWRMLRAWLPELRANAAAFFGAPDALMLPHAVDDGCRVVGSFWTGTIDHACTAWVALMAWEHWRHTRDRRVLEEIAWPLLAGAFGGYHAMCEEREGRLSLPVSVSPEYNGCGMDAWGRDASFQLAAAHAVTRALQQAAAELGRPIDPRWADLRSRLPRWTTFGSPQRIALWQGRDLECSHRHHSHLAGIWPFKTIDPVAEREVVEASLKHWTRHGAGAWSGWCIPWAAVLCARCGAADAAVAWLHWWQAAFTNCGHGTLHDGVEAGLTALSGPWPLRPQASRDGELMQLDAAMGVLWAVCELLVQDRDDHLAILPSVPEAWADASFDGIRTPGAFLVGATVRRRRVDEVRVLSTTGGELAIAPNLGPAFTVDGVHHEGTLLRVPTAPGQHLVLRRMLDVCSL
ncbi:MAG: hypothetical protein J0M02_00290 [Planctomycetes bacterium]|nr:hypothetical protein [Planctomycetota bacterium]